MLTRNKMIKHQFAEDDTERLVVSFGDAKAGVLFDTSAVDVETTYES